MRSKFYVLAALLIAASMVLGACGTTPTPETIIQTVIVEGTPQVIEITATPGPVEPTTELKTLRFVTGPGDIPTLDPSLAQDTSSIQIAIETFGGLTRPDEVTNETLPGLAESWDISEDGRVYTFHIMQNVPWVKYDAITDSVIEVLDEEGAVRMVNANDFYYAFMRTL
ncbi:MAG: hypothetical protein ABFD29_08165, partial [Anaerolineaceae bacterium]